MFKVRCTKCSKIITSERKSNQPTEEIPAHIQQYLKSQIAAIKEELHRQSVSRTPHLTSDEESEEAVFRRALICEGDPAVLETISRVLEKLGYAVDTAPTAAEALKKIESQIYQLVTVELSFPDDKDGARKIIGRMNGQKALQRRGTFVILISPQHKTGDQTSAFMLGANWIVHKADLANLGSAIAEGQQHFRHLYTLFNRVLAEKDQQI